MSICDRMRKQTGIFIQWYSINKQMNELVLHYDLDESQKHNIK